jgi:hypothetical protein
MRKAKPDNQSFPIKPWTIDEPGERLQAVGKSAIKKVLLPGC